MEVPDLIYEVCTYKIILGWAFRPSIFVVDIFSQSNELCLAQSASDPFRELLGFSNSF